MSHSRCAFILIRLAVNTPSVSAKHDKKHNFTLTSIYSGLESTYKQASIFTDNRETYQVNTAQTDHVASNATTTPVLIEHGLQYLTNVVWQPLSGSWE